LPVAVNCWFVPAARDGFAGVTVIEVSAAAVTVTVVDPVIDPELAETVVEPVATAVANPLVEILATAGADEFHVAVPVRSWVLPSL
jgi:hypothetical protein